VLRRPAPFQPGGILLTLSILVDERKEIKSSPKWPTIQDFRPIPEKLLEPSSLDSIDNQEFANIHPHYDLGQAPHDGIPER